MEQRLTWLQQPHFAGVVIVCVFLAQWLCLFNLRSGVWDGAFYYAYGRSLAFDGDLDLVNDFLLSYPTGSPDYVNKQYHLDLTQEGRVHNPFAVGSGLLWLPFLLVIRLGAALFMPLAVLTGYEWFFVGPTAVFSSLSALIGFWVSYKLARQFASQAAALAATVTLMFTTPLLYYQFREPFYAHAFSAFLTTLVIFVWWQQWQTPGQWPQAMQLGLLLGLAILVRWQHLIYFLLPAASVVWWWWQRRRDGWQTAVYHPLRQLILTGLVTSLVVSIQLVVWHQFYGSWITVPQGSSFVDWTAPYIWPTLFSPFRGLIPWMPVFVPAFIGLLLLLRQHPRLALPLLALLLLEIYVNGSTRDWFGGGGYGPRRVTGAIAIFVLGYAVLLTHLPRWWQVAAGWILGLLLVGHQLLLLRFGLPDKLGGRVVSMAPLFEWQETTLSRFATELWQRGGVFISQPASFLVYPNAPLFQVMHRQWPVEPLVAFLIAVVLLYAGWVGWQKIKQRPEKRPLWAAFLTVVIILFDCWLLLVA